MRWRFGRRSPGADRLGKVVVEKEMGYTQAEFYRILPKALGSSDYETANGGREILFEQAGARLKITLSEEKIRTITPLMRIPYMEVTFTFEGFAEEGLADLRRRLDRSFQKGGG